MSELKPLGRNETRQLLAERAVVPSKALGQNFVVDPNTLEWIARLADITPGERIIEIGPGLGSLSAALLAVGARLTVVEIDKRLVAILRQRLPASVRIVEGDALHCDWDAVIATAEADEEPGPFAVVANLPYNIATPLVLDLLEREPRIARMLVMVQREVAERLVATSGTSEYGQVSVRIAYFASARIVGRVPPDVFFPRPKVESSLVSITRRLAPAIDPSQASYAQICTLVRAGFGTRRKMLRRSLAGLVNDATFEQAGVAPTARAEDLDIDEWGKLAACRHRTSSSPTPS